MRVAVTFRHMEATDALRAYAEEKILHAERLIRNAIDAHVVLSVTKRRHCAEITLLADHDSFNAKEETEDLYSAIDLAIAKVESQLRKHATKRSARKHSHAGEPAPEREEPTRTRIEPKPTTVELLSIREAMEVAERQRHDAMIFRDPGSGALLFMYRKKDGSFALLEPEGI